MLDQAVVEYGNQNFTGAADLAQIAYLDNYEHLSSINGGNRNNEKGNVQNAINTRVPLSELQQLVNTIDGNLMTAQQLFA